MQYKYMRTKIKLKKGNHFGMLTVIGEAPIKYLPCGQKNRFILCKCDCGKNKEIRLLHLIRGRIQSCGCKNPHHGMYGTGLHTSWRAMKNRCKES